MAEVKIYTTPTCHFCKLAKAYFQENGIDYTEKDVTVDETARDEMIGKTGQLGVPVIQVDDEFVIGFDQNKIEELLK